MFKLFTKSFHFVGVAICRWFDYDSRKWRKL